MYLPSICTYHYIGKNLSEISVGVSKPIYMIQQNTQIRHLLL